MYDNYDNKIKYNCINILQILSPTKHKLKGLHSFMSSFSTLPPLPIAGQLYNSFHHRDVDVYQAVQSLCSPVPYQDNVETSSRIACAEQCHSSKPILELDTNN